MPIAVEVPSRRRARGWFSSSLVFAICVVGLACGCARPVPVPEVDLAGGTLKKLFGGGSFTEGPAVAPDGTVYFSDQVQGERPGGPSGRIWRFDPQTGNTTVAIEPSGMANGLEFDLEGNLLAAEGADSGGRRIVRHDLAHGTVTVLAGMFAGRRFNSPNDLVVDRNGAVYFTDPRYSGKEPIEQPVPGIYRTSPSGATELVVDQLTRPNGLALSPDNSTLYVAHDNFLWPEPSARTSLLAYDVDVRGGLTYRTSLYDFSSEGSPDGMAVDVDGNIYVAVYELKAVSVHQPDGRRRGLIRLPESPTNVGFGRGTSDHILYITAGGGLYSVDARISGYHASIVP